MPHYDLLVVGGVGIDTIVHVPALPMADADSIHVGPIKDYVAHTGNGVAQAAHALGYKTKLIDFIGADPEADLIHARYREVGLDFSYVVHPSGTRRSVNLVEPGGRRLSLYDGRHPFELRMERDVYLPFLREARHAHFSIMQWARFLYDDAQALGIPVSTDLHDWDGINDYHREFALRSDIVFMSTAALPGRFEQVMREVQQAGRATIVVAMAGAQGSYLLTRSNDTIQHFGCADLGLPIVDSNGAGDAFVSGFLHGHFNNKPPAECMRLGAICGAYACTSAVTAEAFLKRSELEGFANH
ncbi:MAG: carbohydrate kinase family protein [Burkholderiales bacterium]|nr:carbohydrate kinase family protein [Burkholderiales bacterium]